MKRIATVAMLVAAPFVASMSSVAHADARDAAAADVLFRDGRARMEAGDVAHACPKFAESLRLDFAPGTLLNLAACEEQLGQLASAWQHFVQLSEQLPTTDERRAYALERASKLEGRVPRLAITIAHAPAGTTLTNDDVVLPAASLGEPLPVNPGDHHVVVAAPGRAEARFTINLREGERRSLSVVAGEVTAAEIDRRAHAERRRMVGWVVGGAGVLSLATGTYFGVRALNERSRSDALCGATGCRDAAGVSAYDDAKTFSRVADVTLAVGLVAAAVGGYLILSSPSTADESPQPQRAAIRITPFGIGGTW